MGSKQFIRNTVVHAVNDEEFRVVFIKIFPWVNALNSPPEVVRPQDWNSKKLNGGLDRVEHDGLIRYSAHNLNQFLKEKKNKKKNSYFSNICFWIYIWFIFFSRLLHGCRRSVLWKCLVNSGNGRKPRSHFLIKIVKILALENNEPEGERMSSL